MGKVCECILLSKSSHPTEWYRLLEPYPFFNLYKNFLMIDLQASNSKDLKIWNGMVQSKLRILTKQITPYVKVRPWPKVYEKLCSNDLHNLVYFMGVAKQKQITNSTPTFYSW